MGVAEAGGVVRVEVTAAGEEGEGGKDEPVRFGSNY